MKTLDSRVGDVLRVKFKLGLFDHPYVADPKAADKIVHNAEAKRNGFKNEPRSNGTFKKCDNLLPLNKLKTYW
ncbi:hypothetical protein [Mucilaginibacter sp.]|uniref:hypothetical protein n=1 Tax=Mucilaginibacter sp. TaxID=1882438 RepID=UPI003D13C120